MQEKYLIRQEVPQVFPYDAQAMAEGLGRQLVYFLFPLLVELDGLLDKRLVRTFVQTIQVIIAFRDRANGLLLSELGGYLDGPEKAPAGTKRLSNLLHSCKWAASLISHFLWHQATQQLQQWVQSGQDGLALWDERVVEKPQSQKAEGGGPVRSSKAARLTHIKPGYYRPPSAPILVPGMNWLAVLLVGRDGQQGPPLGAAMRWWTNRGPRASFKRDEEARLLVALAASWGRWVIHVLDQGFAGTLWLGLLLAYQLRFVLRWRYDYQLIDAQGNRRKAWQIARGKRGWSERCLWDSRRQQWAMGSVLAFPVRHPEFLNSAIPLTLVISRSKGRAPWYILTSEPIRTDEDAWRVVFAYARRWQIELTWRYDKSELAFQSPRLWHWEEREKLLLMATLAYAFLLSLLEACFDPLRLWLLRQFCHRTGAHCRQAKLPLYRLRAALSRLWLRHPPSFTRAAQRAQPSSAAA